MLRLRVSLGCKAATLAFELLACELFVALREWRSAIASNGEFPDAGCDMVGIFDVSMVATSPAAAVGAFSNTGSIAPRAATLIDSVLYMTVFLSPMMKSN